MNIHSLRSRFASQAPPSPSPAAFCLCPVACFPPVAPQQWLWQQSLYAWALAQAQAAVQPSFVEQDWLGVWN